MTDLSPIVLPVVVSVILSLTGAFVVARYSGPAQSAYIAALEGRLHVIAGERDDGMARMSKLEARIVQLEAEVHALQAANDEKDREIAALYRRLDADERRMDGTKRRPAS
jgi:uncharacterized protein YceH (UPF0502 family)